MDRELLQRIARRIDTLEGELSALKADLARLGAADRPSLDDVFGALACAADERADRGRSTRINAVKGRAEKALGFAIRPEEFGFDRYLALLQAGVAAGRFRLVENDGWRFEVDLPDTEEDELAILQGIRAAAEDLIAEGRNTQVPSIIGLLERRGAAHRPRAFRGRYVDFLRRGQALGLYELRQNAAGHWCVLVDGSGGGPDTVAAIKALRGKDLDELVALKEAHADYDYDYDYDDGPA